MSTPRPSSTRVPFAAIIIFVVGALIAAVAVLAPKLGLGRNEIFILYMWLGWSRTDAALIGAAVTAAAAVLALAHQYRSLVQANWRTWLANALLMVASLIVGLVFSEVAVRLLDGRPVFAMTNWLAERNALLTVHTLSEYDPLLGWVLRPGQSHYPDDARHSFTTGPHGIRLSRPDAGPPAKGAILAVGDSFTAGSEVGDRAAWPAQLETMLGEPVVNGAAGGWGIDQMVLRAESLLDELRPHTVIVGIYEGDIQRTGQRVYGGANKPYFAAANDRLVLHNNPVPVYRGRVNETPLWLLVPSYSYLVIWTMDHLGWSDWWQRVGVSYVDADNDPVDVSCRLLRILRDRLVERGGRLMVVMLYGGRRDQHMLKPGSGPQAIVARARDSGIATVDLWDAFAAVRRRSFKDYVSLWASFDGGGVFGHMSEQGNRIVAERIYEALKVSVSKRLSGQDR
jgi:hypothetical protein